MNYIKMTLALGAIICTTYACNKREIIPAPTPKVDLENHFFGKFDGTDVEFTQNVNGYAGSSNADFTISASDIDKAVYYSTMSSESSSRSITIGHGSIEFDNGTSDVPTLSLFNNFWNTYKEPLFSEDGINGFVVRYRDANGIVWKSNEDHDYPLEDVIYTNIVQESDDTGDYSNFQVNFATNLYHTFMNIDQFGDTTYDTQSILLTDAVYKGWYKR